MPCARALREARLREQRRGDVGLHRRPQPRDPVRGDRVVEALAAPEEVLQDADDDVGRGRRREHLLAERDATPREATDEGAAVGERQRAAPAERIPQVTLAVAHADDEVPRQPDARHGDTCLAPDEDPHDREQDGHPVTALDHARQVAALDVVVGLLAAPVSQQRRGHQLRLLAR